MIFWLIALILMVAVAWFVLRPLLRVRNPATFAQPSPDLQVYRDQLIEVESDLAKGVLSNDEAERTRLEVSRRLLEADKVHSSATVRQQANRQTNLLAAVAAGVVLLVGTGLTYRMIGANGAPDLPLVKRNAQMVEQQANRPAQSVAEASVGDITELGDQAEEGYKALVAQLRETAAARPNDPRGQELLAEHEARLGNFAAARIAKGRMIELMGDDAGAQDFTDLAELMIIAAGGYVSPEAERALSNAISLAPRDQRTRYYSGLDLAQNGRPDLAYRLWTELLEEGPPNAPWIGPIQQQIGDVARMAGLPAPQLPGPSSQQVEDAGDMTAEERQQMIEGMVAQLSARLANDGGTADEWARLISAYGVLGDTKRAADVWGEAQQEFADDAAAMTTLRAAAKAVGITE